jgi:hypothetical protein
VLAIEYDLFFDLIRRTPATWFATEASRRSRRCRRTRPVSMDLRGAAPGAFRRAAAHATSRAASITWPSCRSAAGRGHRARSRQPRIRPVASAIRHTAPIATPFTVAHSITLAIAALGWMTLLAPGREPGRGVDVGRRRQPDPPEPAAAGC